MCVAPSDRPEVVVDGRPDDRVDEGDRITRHEHLQRCQRIDRSPRVRELQPSELGDEVRCGVASQDRHRLGHADGRLAHAADPGEHRTGDAVGAQLRDPARACRRRLDALRGQGGEQLSDQLGVAARRAMAGRREPWSRLDV
jgi:hypothetical protein